MHSDPPTSLWTCSRRHLKGQRGAIGAGMTGDYGVFYRKCNELEGVH